MPTPIKGESKDAYMARCHKVLAGEGNSDSAQRSAICYSMWNKHMKKWIIFDRDYEDGDKQKFTKGTTYQVDGEVADSLVKLGIAKEGTDPTTDFIGKALEKLTATLEEKLEKSYKGMFDKMNEAFKGVKVPGFSSDADKLEKMGGFKEDGEFVDALIKAGANNGSVDPRLMKAPSGQNTRDDVLGGYVVPEDISQRILEFVFDDYDGMNVLSKTDNNYCSGDSMRLPTMPETSRKSGYRDAGVIAYWLAEADQFTSSTVKWGTQRLELNKVIALLYATEEQISDSFVALGDIFTRKAGSAIRFNTNLALFQGTGVGQPLGILRSNSTITQALETSPVVQATTQDVILHQNINGMYHKIMPRYRPGAAWYMHPNTYEKLEYISFNDDTTNKRPIYLPGGSYGKIDTAPFGTLKGLPIIPWEYCYDAGQRGDIMLANWSPYQTLQKRDGGVKSASSIHVRFLYEEQAFRFSFRIDGKSSLVSAVEDLNGSTRRSNAVVLAARTSEGSSSGL